MTFLEKYKINNSYQDFFTDEIIEIIEEFLENTENYTPIKENIFKLQNYCRVFNCYGVCIDWYFWTINFPI